jgi:hypothetical protein
MYYVSARSFCARKRQHDLDWTAVAASNNKTDDRDQRENHSACLANGAGALLDNYYFSGWCDSWHFMLMEWKQSGCVFNSEPKALYVPSPVLRDAWSVVLGSVQLNQVRRAQWKQVASLKPAVRCSFFIRIPMRAWLIIKISRGKRQFHLNHPSKLHNMPARNRFFRTENFSPNKWATAPENTRPLRINNAEIKSFTSTESINFPF